VLKKFFFLDGVKISNSIKTIKPFVLSEMDT